MCPGLDYAMLAPRRGRRRSFARNGPIHGRPVNDPDEEIAMLTDQDSMFQNQHPRSRTASIGFFFTAIAGFVLLAAVGATPALAQAQVKAKFGDWEMRCETPAGAQREQCAIIQSVAAEDKPNMNLVVIALKAADGKSRLLRVIAPLGVLLPAGLGLNIDNADKGRAGFVRCLPSGCVAEVVMDDKLLDDLGAGTSATFVVFETPEQGIGIPLTLKGFKDGFGKLP